MTGQEIAYTALAVAMSVGAIRIFDSWLANLDDAAREHALNDRIAARYSRPVVLHGWHDQTSVPAPTWNYGNSATSGAGTDHTAHAARSEPSLVAHAGTTPTPGLEGSSHEGRAGHHLNARGWNVAHLIHNTRTETSA